MRLRRNRTAVARTPSAAARFDRLAKRRGVVQAETAALDWEHVQGISPWKATPSGLVGEDYAHLLLKGVRNFPAIADGASFYDPTRDEVVLVEPDGPEVLVTIGPLHLTQILGGDRWRRTLAGAVELAVNAYSDDGPGVVSRWLVSKVREAASMTLTDRQSGSPGWTALVQRDPHAIWRQLGKRWVVQPWGLGVAVERLGGWT